MIAFIENTKMRLHHKCPDACFFSRETTYWNVLAHKTNFTILIESQQIFPWNERTNILSKNQEQKCFQFQYLYFHAFPHNFAPYHSYKYAHEANTHIETCPTLTNRMSLMMMRYNAKGDAVFFKIYEVNFFLWLFTFIHL